MSSPSAQQANQPAPSPSTSSFLFGCLSGLFSSLLFIPHNPCHLFFPLWDGFCHLTWAYNKHYGEFSIFIHCTFSNLKSQKAKKKKNPPPVPFSWKWNDPLPLYFTWFLFRSTQSHGIPFENARTPPPPPPNQPDLEGFREFWPLIIVCTIVACHSIWRYSPLRLSFSRWIMVDWHPFVHCWCVAHHKNLTDPICWMYSGHPDYPGCSAITLTKSDKKYFFQFKLEWTQLDYFATE